MGLAAITVSRLLTVLRANARTEGNDHRGCGTRLHIEPQLGVLWRDDLEEGLRESTEKLQGVRQLSALVS